MHEEGGSMNGPHDDWDDHFTESLCNIAVGESVVFYWVSGVRRGLAEKLPSGNIKWTIPGVGDSNAIEISIEDLVSGKDSQMVGDHMKGAA